jgi:hypothetical protein
VVLGIEVDYTNRSGTSRRPKHNVIGLIGGVINSSENVFPFQRGVVGQDLLNGSSGPKQFKNIRDPNALAPDARPPATFALFHSYSA